MWKYREKTVLAPMAGVTDMAFRELCKTFGAAYCITEMVSAKALQYQDKKSLQLAALSEKERPVAIQIFGDEPDTMAYAAEKLMLFSPDILDINMGCPAPKIAAGGGGVSLMRTPELCGKIVRAVCEAVPVPVTVKIRSGWNEQEKNAAEVAQICETAGAKAITVHGRTREQMYRPPVDLESIRAVKKAVNIPVIGNGDIDCAKAAEKMVSETGCDLVMVGRAAQGNPWIFSELEEAFGGKKQTPPQSLAQKLSVMVSHIETMCRYKGETLAMREARKHIAWYIHGLRGAAAFRKRAVELTRLTELYAFAEDILQENQETLCV